MSLPLLLSIKAYYTVLQSNKVSFLFKCNMKLPAHLLSSKSFNHLDTSLVVGNNCFDSTQIYNCMKNHSSKIQKRLQQILDQVMIQIILMPLFVCRVCWETSGKANVKRAGEVPGSAALQWLCVPLQRIQSLRGWLGSRAGCV